MHPWFSKFLEKEIYYEQVVDVRNSKFIQFSNSFWRTSKNGTFPWKFYLIWSVRCIRKSEQNRFIYAYWLPAHAHLHTHITDSTKPQKKPKEFGITIVVSMLWQCQTSFARHTCNANAHVPFHVYAEIITWISYRQWNELSATKWCFQNEVLDRIWISQDTGCNSLSFAHFLHKM